MVSIGPVVMLTIGFFAGLSQAASVTTGNRLGAGDADFALFLGTRSWLFGMIGAIIFGIAVIVASPFYPNIYAVEETTRETMSSILIAFAAVLWIKVSNMIIGGVIKAGGKTDYVFYLDLVGTWVIGVPLGAVAAFVWRLPIAWVYLLIASEEFVRLVAGVVILRSRKWIKTIEA
jgi:Na+-driven multidrug efflux pump